jgi:hypothetical protein
LLGCQSDFIHELFQILKMALEETFRDAIDSQFLVTARMPNTGSGDK